VNSKSLAESLSLCPVCGTMKFSSMSIPAIKIGENVFGERMHLFGLVKCRGCGLEFINPRPSEESIAEFYDIPGCSAHDAYEKSSITNFRLKFVYGLFPNTTLLDYGCGNGYFVKMAKEAGWSAIGIEPSLIGRKNANNLGIEVYKTLGDLSDNRRFNIVTMFHVLEHIPNLDSILSLVRSVMTEDGLLIVEVPNINSFRAMMIGFSGVRQVNDERYRAFPIHLYGFNRRTLARLLLKNGFSPVKITSFDIGINIGSAKCVDNITSSQRVGTVDGHCSVREKTSLKNMLKKWFFSLCLGERLVIVARPVNIGNTVNV
jgi:SAM-dependent methyltransferase